MIIARHLASGLLLHSPLCPKSIKQPIPICLVNIKRLLNDTHLVYSLSSFQTRCVYVCMYLRPSLDEQSVVPDRAKSCVCVSIQKIKLERETAEGGAQLLATTATSHSHLNSTIVMLKGSSSSSITPDVAEGQSRDRQPARRHPDSSSTTAGLAGIYYTMLRGWTGMNWRLYRL